MIRKWAHPISPLDALFAGMVDRRGWGEKLTLRGYRLSIGLVSRPCHDVKSQNIKTEKGVGKVQGAGAGWTGGKVRSPECRVRRAGWWVKCRPTDSVAASALDF